MEIEIMEIYNKLITSKKIYYNYEYNSKLSSRIRPISLNCYEHISVDLENKCFVLCKYWKDYGDDDGNYEWGTLDLKDYGKEWALTREELIRKND